jgi:hypothetical protein
VSNPAHTTTQTQVLGGALIAAPLLLLASTAAFAVEAGDRINRGTVGGAILVYAMAAFALAVLALTQRFAHIYPRAAVGLLVTGVAGCAAGAGFGVDSIHAALPGGGPLEDIGDTAGLLAIFPPGAVFPFTVIAIGIALLRAEPALRRQAIALMLAGIVFPVSRVLDVLPLAILADLVIVAAMVPLGLSALRARPSMTHTAGVNAPGTAAQ